MHLTIYTDGAARGNPGPAGAGAVLLDDSGAVVDEISHYLGEMTNNQAEYRALLLALERVDRLRVTAVDIFADSELMVRQLNGEYRVKNELLRPLFEEITRRLQRVETYTIGHVRREQNAHADRLANEAIDAVHRSKR